MGKNSSNTPVAPVAVDGEKAPEIEVVAPADPAPETAAPATDAAPEVAGHSPTHSIAAGPEKGFYRAGRHWPREATKVARAEFTDDQWAALEAEPKLTIKPL